MLNEIVYSIVAVFVVSLVSLVGVFTLSVREDKLHKIIFFLVALSVGGLLGDVFIHILPEAFAGKDELLMPSLSVLAGMLIFFLLEKFLRWKHYHDISDETCCHDGEEKHEHVGYLSLISDGLHNVIDGAIIGSSFLVGPGVGVATTLAVILHEVPQEIGDFAVMLHSGFSRAKALWFNFLSALTAFIGLGLALYLGKSSENFAELILPFAAGGFIYIAASDLIPELHKTLELRRSLLQVLAILIGIGLMTLLLFMGD
ncbi:MAG: ZIP family metal transporter [bacterium]